MRPATQSTKSRTFAVALIGLTISSLTRAAAVDAAWHSYAENPQHTAVSAATTQPLESIRWSMPVDLTAPAEPILIHYGSPLVTQSNTVIVPVKTGSAGGFRVEARDGADGALIWSQTTDYILPAHSWTPSYSPTLTAANRLYFAGAGGTVYYRDNVDSSGPPSSGQLAFFGLSNYDPASFNTTVFINTPITADSAGNIYFGFRTAGTPPLGLRSGIARISAAGVGSWVSAVTASGGDAAITRVPHQAAPALSNDELTLYAVVAGSNSTASSYLVGLDSATLALKESSPGVMMRVALKDPRNGAANNASVSDNSSSTPMVGPDGDVYYGVLANPFHSRGWMLHFSGALTQVKTPGAFGWDITPSVVAASMVPSYAGTSTYLIFTKYNNYAGSDGGDGVNRIAVLDPNATMVEPHASSNGQLVMKEVLTIAGVTPDPGQGSQFPNAVREWCINSAAVDPSTNSIMVNSEDGILYRWDLTTNTLSESVTLSTGAFEAYTPTVIGPDGTVYAINFAVLNAVGSTVATPTITPTNTLTETATPADTGTSTSTPVPSSTQTPTNAPSGTVTRTPTRTFTNTATRTPTRTPSSTRTSTPTRTRTATRTPSPTATQTPCTATYIERDLVGDCVPAAGGTGGQLTLTTAAAATLSRTVPLNAIDEVSFAFTGDSSNVATWAAGKYSVELNITAAGNGLKGYKAQLVRVDSSCDVVATLATSSNKTGTGIKTFTFTVPVSAGESTDRLQVRVLSTSKESPDAKRALSIQVNTTASEVRVPWCSL